jgi:hypothetical protein
MDLLRMVTQISEYRHAEIRIEICSNVRARKCQNKANTFILTANDENNKSRWPLVYHFSQLILLCASTVYTTPAQFDTISQKHKFRNIDYNCREISVYFNKSEY